MAASTARGLAAVLTWASAEAYDRALYLDTLTQLPCPQDSGISGHLHRRHLDFAPAAAGPTCFERWSDGSINGGMIPFMLSSSYGWRNRPLPTRSCGYGTTSTAGVCVQPKAQYPIADMVKMLREQEDCQVWYPPSCRSALGQLNALLAEAGVLTMVLR
ncbi:NAD(P) transhydrogenase, mitochondrial-like protein [Lates japonicus]|uniref:NAD(P) transhydrogenase, mitochondrial-like protein n=1 Tax=Lates japonicus TaxID=270547 RepID=A0AAD3R5H1_LATJO|nr:NAD(P) transhydrogenase, mitochondrial-like protein [Lates japonicus]